ncbi:MAG: 2-oxoacid:acceptor oxidoreductase family protein [Candidatus Zambryskibacteria bacterium]|nr:2-oxoacid:acceptor oxidoreductase family protein [Candidatus Zambryskibacteria bacterium]
MSDNLDKNIFTIGVGGAAGDGVKSLGVKIGEILCNRGFNVYLSLDYPSLIRGGHNFIRLSFGKEKVWNDYTKLNVLVALNTETEQKHKNELKQDAQIISKNNHEEVLEKIKSIIKIKGFESANFKGLPVQAGQLIEGNVAFAKGLQAAGLDFYIAYPMTPATSVLHYLAGEQKSSGIKVIQPENEIAVINMALGSAFAGKRTAIGTAGGGFALMQEAFSLAGITELPLVVMVSQRQAPATGVPTYSSQSDLRFVIHAGHGEFPRIVIAPGDSEESFCAGRNALNLAWKYQMPVIVLLDKVLSEHMITATLNETKMVEKGKIARETDLNYERYKITEDGISPMAFPGTTNAVIKVNSYEHNEKGITIDDPEIIKKMIEKRFSKMKNLETKIQNIETIKIYGDENSKNTIIFFGSTKSPVLEAAKYLKTSTKLIQIIWLEPFDKNKVKAALQTSEKIICVEANHNGQLASLVSEKTGIKITDKILKYDSKPFDPVRLAEEINNKII